MYRPALIALSLLLTACGPAKPNIPEVVYVTVEKIVPVPAKLTKRVPVYQVQDQSIGEAVKAANLRKVGLETCNARLGEIEGLGE